METVLALEKLESYTDRYIACHECDLVHPVRRLLDGEIAACGRCGAVLYQQRRNSMDRSLAFALTGLILFIAANMFPLLTFEMEGREQSNRLIDGSLAFWKSGYWELGLLVFISSVAVPFFSLISILYVLLPLKFSRIPKGFVYAVRSIEWLKPWAMSEVFILGIIVAFVKLTDFATVTPGPSMAAFVGMVIAITLANVTLDDRVIWRLEEDIRTGNEL
ncbi:paraquat-inducible protein A [Aestuariispira insulae]|uniref:Paraquat-inducible protein A n=1 Tax=Aestuariispira insulae TaxID=1461337 RepID=A0A3D9HFR9_9PROT|nr:paraquat-inducible protein A [Aestuariispira insulae]RED48101.1 paraquat-inducible protein A [Aestuariispira insulae]